MLVAYLAVCSEAGGMMNENENDNEDAGGRIRVKG